MYNNNTSSTYDIDNNLLNVEGLNNAMTSVSVPVLVNLIREAHKPINEKLEKINENYDNRITTLEGRVQIIFPKMKRLKPLQKLWLICKKSINLIDWRTRSNNIIITGLAEGHINYEGNDGNNIVLQNDREKVEKILALIQCNSFTANGLERFQIERIGKRRDAHNRVVKIKLASSQERNDFMKNAKILKTLNEPWKLIYIKKDLHPVYVSENNRIRKEKKCVN